MSYEESLDVLDQVCQIIASHHLPPVKQRKFSGIFNAMEMQIEDGEYDLEVVDHLGKALLALARVYQLETSPLEKALGDLRRILEA
jgi:hypothetical protein